MLLSSAVTACFDLLRYNFVGELNTGSNRRVIVNDRCETVTGHHAVCFAFEVITSSHNHIL